MFINAPGSARGPASFSAPPGRPFALRQADPGRARPTRQQQRSRRRHAQGLGRGGGPRGWRFRLTFDLLSRWKKRRKTEFVSHFSFLPPLGGGLRGARALNCDGCGCLAPISWASLSRAARAASCTSPPSLGVFGEKASKRHGVLCHERRAAAACPAQHLERGARRARLSSRLRRRAISSPSRSFAAFTTGSCPTAAARSRRQQEPWQPPSQPSHSQLGGLRSLLLLQRSSSSSPIKLLSSHSTRSAIRGLAAQPWQHTPAAQRVGGRGSLLGSRGSRHSWPPSSSSSSTCGARAAAAAARSPIHSSIFRSTFAAAAAAALAPQEQQQQAAAAAAAATNPSSPRRSSTAQQQQRSRQPPQCRSVE
jgi:hypothetical protein